MPLQSRLASLRLLWPPQCCPPTANHEHTNVSPFPRLSGFNSRKHDSERFISTATLRVVGGTGKEDGRSFSFQSLSAIQVKKAPQSPSNDRPNQPSTRKSSEIFSLLREREKEVQTATPLYVSLNRLGGTFQQIEKKHKLVYYAIQSEYERLVVCLQLPTPPSASSPHRRHSE